MYPSPATYSYAQVRSSRLGCYLPQGIFFVLALKAIPTVTVRVPSEHERRVWPDVEREDARKTRRPGSTPHGLQLQVPPGSEQTRAPRDGRVAGESNESVRCSVDILGQETGDADVPKRQRVIAADTASDGQGARRSPGVDLPPQHWRCSVCKKARGSEIAFISVRPFWRCNTGFHRW